MDKDPTTSTDARRTLADLIEELNREKQKFFVVCLVVGFESETKYVWAGQPDALKTLTELVKAGGEPVGMIGIQKHNKTLSVCRKNLAEYGDAEWVAKYLASLTAAMRDSAIEQGIASPDDEFSAGEWVN